MRAGGLHTPVRTKSSQVMMQQRPRRALLAAARQLPHGVTRQKRQHLEPFRELPSAWPRPQSASRRASLSCNAFASPSSLPKDSVDFANAFSYLPGNSTVPAGALLKLHSVFKEHLAEADGVVRAVADFSDQMATSPVDAPPQPLPRAVEGAVDDPALHNPLQRQERLGTGWMGVIIEYEGIVSNLSAAAHLRSGLSLFVSDTPLLVVGANVFGNGCISRSCQNFLCGPLPTHEVWFILTLVHHVPQAVEDFSDLHTRAWVQLAAEEGKPQPFAWALKRAEGMKNEQVRGVLRCCCACGRQWRCNVSGNEFRRAMHMV